MRIANNYCCWWPVRLRVINLRELSDLNFGCAGTLILWTIWFGKGVFLGRIGIMDHHLKKAINQMRWRFMCDGGFSRWNISLINHHCDSKERIYRLSGGGITQFLDIDWSCQLERMFGTMTHSQDPLAVQSAMLFVVVVPRCPFYCNKPPKHEKKNVEFFGVPSPGHWNSPRSHSLSYWDPIYQPAFTNSLA